MKTALYFAYVLLFVSLVQSVAAEAQHRRSLVDLRGDVTADDAAAIETAVGQSLAAGVVVTVVTSAIDEPGFRARVVEQNRMADLILVFPYDEAQFPPRAIGGAAVDDATVGRVQTALEAGFVPTPGVSSARTYSRRLRDAVIAALPLAKLTQPTAAVPVPFPLRGEVQVVDADAQRLVNDVLDSLIVSRNDWLDVRDAFLATRNKISEAQYLKRARLETRIRNALQRLEDTPQLTLSDSPVTSVSHSTGWGAATGSWSFEGPDALRYERDRFFHHADEYAVTQMIDELLTVRHRYTTYDDLALQIFGDRLKNISPTPHKYQLELKSIATVGADWGISFIAGAINVEQANCELSYSNELMPSIAWAMDVNCIASAVESGATYDENATARAVTAINVVDAATFAAWVWQKIATVAKLLPSPSFTFLADEDQTDKFNSAALLSDRIYSPESKLGLWPYHRITKSTSVSTVIGSQGVVKEYTYLGVGSNAILMNTSGDSRLVGFTGTKIAEVGNSIGAANGFCIGSNVRYGSGPVPAFPGVDLLNFDATVDTFRPLAILMPVSATAAERSALVTEVKELADEVAGACPDCGTVVSVTPVVSGAWPGRDDPTWADANAGSSASAVAAAVADNFQGAVDLADAITAALTTAPGAVPAGKMRQSAPDYHRVSALAKRLEEYEEPVSLAANQNWHRAVEIEVTVVHDAPEDRSAGIQP